MKKSMENAMHEAKKLSEEHDIIYYVMDKRNGKTACYSELLIDNPVFFYDLFKKGYYPVCKFVNGQKSAC